MVRDSKVRRSKGLARRLRQQRRTILRSSISFGVGHAELLRHIRAALARLTEKGARLIDEIPRPGAHGFLVAFIHPSSAHGVLVELKQGVSLEGVEGFEDRSKERRG